MPCLPDCRCQAEVGHGGRYTGPADVPGGVWGCQMKDVLSHKKQYAIINGDCLHVMRDLPDKCVDAVITDPPYGIDFQSRRTNKEKRHKKIANDKRPFIWWLYDAYRVTKDGGALLCFCRWDVQEVFRQAIEWAGFKIKSHVIWDRGTHGMGDLKASYAPQHDIIWFAIKNGFSFGGNRPHSVLRCQRLPAKKLNHPNEKPIELMVQLIMHVTKEGSLVLDPFLGSGTTAIAALNMGRRIIGIELDRQHYRICLDRVLPEVEKRMFTDGGAYQ